MWGLSIVPRLGPPTFSSKCRTDSAPVWRCTKTMEPPHRAFSMALLKEMFYRFFVYLFGSRSAFYIDIAFLMENMFFELLDAKPCRII